MKIWVLAASLLFSPTSFAAEYEADPSNYQTLLGQLQPGDILRLAAGRYPQGLVLENLEGAPGRPIRIEGPASGPRAVMNHRGVGPSAVALRGVAYLELAHLEIDLMGASAQGLQAEQSASAHDIVLDDIYVHGHPANQQLVGISTKVPAWNVTIRNCVVEGAGTGIYLGDSDGTDPFIAGLVENNLVVDPVGYAMQIKFQAPRPNLAGMPTGVSRTIIRHNVFMKANNASTGDNARPNLLVGHYPLSGPGTDDRYEIYGNFLYQNASMQEPLFQGSGNIAFYANILVNTQGPGAWFVPHKGGGPRTVDIFNNTIFTSGRPILVSGGEGGFVQRVEANAVFADQGISGGAAAANVQEGRAGAAQRVVRPGDVLGMMDYHPLAGQLADAALDRDRWNAYQDFDRDFDGQPWAPGSQGAYAGPAGPSAWRLAAERKFTVAVMPPVDSGVVDSGGLDASLIDLGVPDGGVDSPDAGFDDAGIPVDSGPRPDAQPVIREPAGTEGGCTCWPQNGAQGGFWGLLAFGMLFWVRRIRG